HQSRLLPTPAGDIRSAAAQPPATAAWAYARSADADARPCLRRGSSLSSGASPGAAHCLQRQTVEQLGQACQFGTPRQHRIDIGKETRHIGQIARLTITMTNARKNTDDLE